ncbi:MAG: hydantoinase B/oxoprolinase family protein [Rhodospirillaceae bacterium]|jgi:N-methylhydantoinase B|nr:hydantoinase B/oxoprolinase family protein [Rhodospirillaceae bacterium]MBT5809928.1 hydantoinase B/oxoprolinase family protein [Rhodospirillaceae bacterium]
MADRSEAPDPIAPNPTAPDPITTEVVSRHVLAAAAEMGIVLMRTAFSPNIKERNDCSTAVFNARGDVVAQAEHIAIHLGSMIGAIENVTARFDPSEIRPGDMFVANDPYNGGGSHLPDLNVIAPVFHDGRIVAYVANIAHHADVGGMVPGSEAAVCETIFQEGLRLPPVRLVREGAVNRDVIDIILLNSRTPEERRGDLNAQIAANNVGVRSMTRLIERYGLDVFDRALDAYLDFSARRMEAAVRDLPEGRYEAEDFISSADENAEARLACALTIAQGRMKFDFTGTDPQLNEARNIPHQALLATVYTVAKALLDPGAPANGGAFRVIDIAAPSGCIVQPTPPAPVGARSLSCGVLSDVVLAALSQAIPDKGMARCGPHGLILLSGTDPRDGRYFVNYETVAGGLGALPHRDGLDAVRTLTSGSANLPVEALEHDFPVRVERYALRDGSGGEGRHRGGRGVLRDYRILGESMTVSLTGERQRVPARGVAGGADGSLGEFVINPGASDEIILGAAVKEAPLPRGSVLRVGTPGGAGWGDSSGRAPDLVEQDEREGR